MGKFRISLVFSAFFAYSLCASGYEVDNFTHRDSQVQDSMKPLDQEVNRILDKALKVANQESPDHCNRVILRREVVRWVGPDPVSFMELWASFTNDLQQIRVSTRESIYQDASFRESPAIVLAGIGNTLNINGVHVGTDKLGHFFMQGYDYFKMVEGGMSLDHVLRYEHGEDGIWGLAMTGVKSYGDMATNYQGYRFWSSLYSGENPYFRCDHLRKWVRARQFTWADYINDAWDESINCSEMVPTLEAKVEQRLNHLGMHCPVDPGRCIRISSLEKSEYYVSPKCRAVALK